MTERVLTDKEVEDVLMARGGWTMLNLARAVEAAAVTKCHANFKADLEKTFKNAAYLPHREVRERERAAAAWGCDQPYRAETASFRDALNNRYPLPTVKRAREVRLDDGRCFSGSGILDSFRGPLTVLDMEKLVDLAKHPMEDVPE